MSNERTLGKEITYSGIGLHTGKTVKMCLIPAPMGTGIIFRRVDLPGAPQVKARPSNVGRTLFCTGLLSDEVQVHTIEHLMASFAGMSIDNVIVELDSVEPPVGDGSAKVFVELIEEAGITEGESQAKSLVVDEPVWVSDKGAKTLIALPYDGFKVSYTFVADHPAVRDQFAEFHVSPDTFLEELAPARTFASQDIIKALEERNMAQGGTPDIAVVIGEKEILTPLRFPDELVRHKVLDLVGDLWLLGRIKAHVIGIRSGHALNNKLARKLEERIENARRT